MRGSIPKYVAIIILLFFGLLLIIPHVGAEPKTPETVKGVLDLSEWDFTPDNTVPLNGEWEFYWKQLLTPADFAGSEGGQTPELTGYISVPGQWNGNLNGVELQKFGYATYRLVIKVPPTENTFGIKTEHIRVTSKLFVNGVLLGGSGRPAANPFSADNRTDTMPDNVPYTAFFSLRGDRVEIILQVANYAYAAGGIVLPVKEPSRVSWMKLVIVACD